MKKAFTLIELLVVVLIIGILSSIALPSYNRAVYRAKMSQLDVTLNAFYKAIDVYLLTNGGFPDTETYFTGNVSNRIELDIGIQGVPSGGGDNTCTKDGYWKAYCDSSSCKVHFWSNLHEKNGTCVAQTSWFGGINTRYTKSAPKWTLSSIQDEKHKKEICLWWRDKYGISQMTSSVKTECAAVGVN